MNPYKNWDREDFIYIMRKQCDSNKIDQWIRDIVEEAFRSDWDFINKFDGCTIVQDDEHPSIPCFVHDYLQRMGMGGRLSDEIFLVIMNKVGLSDWDARIRYIGVRLGWFMFFKWKHLFNGNVKEYSEGMINYLKEKENGKV